MKVNTYENLSLKTENKCAIKQCIHMGDRQSD